MELKNQSISLITGIYIFKSKHKTEKGHRFSINVSFFYVTFSSLIFFSSPIFIRVLILIYTCGYLIKNQMMISSFLFVSYLTFAGGIAWKVHLSSRTWFE